jgi:hypothetical protein
MKTVCQAAGFLETPKFVDRVEFFRFMGFKPPYAM